MARKLWFSNVAIVGVLSIGSIVWLLFSPSPRSKARVAVCKDGSNCFTTAAPKLSNSEEDRKGLCDCSEEIKRALSASKQDALHPYRSTPCPIQASPQDKCSAKNISTSFFGSPGYGLRKNDEVYISFDDIKYNLELIGEKSTSNKFEIKLTNLQLPSVEVQHQSKYSPSGAYMKYHLHEIDRRSRVICISGRHSIPVSRQWHDSGHFYPIQICQYGLSYYGRHILDRATPDVHVVEDGSLKTSSQWEKDASCTIDHKEKDSKGISFNCEGSDAMLQVKLNSKHHIMKIYMSLDPSTFSGVAATVLGSDGKSYRLIYANTNDVLSHSDRKMIIGVSDQPGYFLLLRDLKQDLHAFIAKKNIPAKVVFTELQSIEFFGQGELGNISTSDNADKDKLYAAANWLLDAQDSSGGWPVKVTHKITAGVVSHAGSYSAMAQGQAISLLCRMYSLTKERKFIKAAGNALSPFHHSVSEKGVVSHIWGNHTVWYEEYATNPSLHVLNGFIFSLIGLYDLSQMESQYSTEALELFNRGFESLISILPLYDNGHGTFYDLRHVVLLGKEPNRARWQYHTLHVSQLMLLDNIRPTPAFVEIAKRWKGYAEGKRARHN